MGLFTCCRSDTNAVNEQAHAKSIVIAEEKARKGGNFDEDLQAVQWMRDRSLERSLERSLKDNVVGEEDLMQLKPPSFDQAVTKAQQPEVKEQESFEKTPKRRNNKKLGGGTADDDLDTSTNMLEDLLEESQQQEKMRILSHEEANAADRDEMKDQPVDKRTKRERRRKPDVEEPPMQVERKLSSSRKSNKAATISAAAMALKLDNSQRSSSSPDKRRKSKSSSSPAVTTPQRESPSRKKQQVELDLEPDLQVDSDVDSLARDQYLIAVQLLHRRMIQKQESLNPAEKEFLHDLLQQEPEEEDQSSLAEKLSVIELTIEQLDASQRLGAVPLPESIGGTATKTLFPDPLTIPFNDEVGTVPEDRKSEVSVYSATSSHSGIGVETTLGGRRRRRRSSSRSKTKRSKGEVTRPPLDEQLPTLRPENVTDDDYDEEDEIGAPYPIIGASALQSRLLKTRLMEALRGFLPYAVSEENFWLKFSLERDGASLHTLQNNLRASQYSLLVIQAKEDGRESLFGAFTSSPWRRKESWFGTGQSFLFKKTDTLEVYPFTGSDDLVQYCSSQMLAIGGGDWSVESPFSKHEKKGIGLLIDGDLQGGESYSCATFCNPKLSRRNEFSILNMEVWTLTPCMTAFEAEKLEKHKLFVAQNSREATK